MGKNKDLDVLQRIYIIKSPICVNSLIRQFTTQSSKLSIIRLIVNTVVHEIVVRHTNRPESEHFLEAEIIEYRGQAKKAAKSHNWNDNDKQHVEDNAQIKIKEKLKIKYSDVLFKDEEIVKNLKKIINELM